MNTKHTPGPWSIDDDGIIVSQFGDVAQVAGTVADDETLPNQRLLAAAPELLAALEAAIGAHDGNWDQGQGWEKKARAAIAKAKGSV